MGNEKSKIFFWDLQRLEEGSDGKDEGQQQQGQGVFKVPKRKSRGGDVLGEMREMSIVSNASSGVVSSNSSAPPEKKYSIRDPFAPVAAHKSITVPRVSFAMRQVAWSTGGEWCVAVGDCGMICLFRRWE